jgi:NAD(P)-dependent dehydrogenase (short-subunit alcohol dehydrogenase family)
MARLWSAEGANVSLCARTDEDLARAEAELRQRGANVLTCAADIRVQSEVERFVGRTLDRFGRIDVLVNNAGIIQTGPVQCMTLADYQDAMQTHFWGPLYAILTVLPHMRQQGGGRIVNITSI